MSRDAVKQIENSKAEGNARVLLHCLADAMNSVTGECWLAIGTMAHRTSMSERAVQYALRELEDSGEVEIRPSTGGRRTNVYTLGPKYGAPNSTSSKSIHPSDPDQVLKGLGANNPKQGCTGVQEGDIDYPITRCPRCGGWFYSEHLANPKIVDVCGTHCKVSA